GAKVITIAGLADLHRSQPFEGAHGPAIGAFDRHDVSTVDNRVNALPTPIPCAHGREREIVKSGPECPVGSVEQVGSDLGIEHSRCTTPISSRFGRALTGWVWQPHPRRDSRRPRNE